MSNKLYYCAVLLRPATRLQDRIVIQMQLINKSFENVADFEYFGTAVKGKKVKSSLCF